MLFPCVQKSISQWVTLVTFVMKKKMYPLSHMTSTPIKPNLYFANRVAVVLSDPDIWRVLIFYVSKTFPVLLLSHAK